MKEERAYKSVATQTTKIVFAIVLALGLAPIVAPTQAAYADSTYSAGVTNNLAGTISQGTQALNGALYDENSDQISNPTNLLVDNEGVGRELVSDNGDEFALTQVDITRYRQKVIVEYYYGDMNSSTLVGTDEGYADYTDSYNDYIKDIPGINAAYGTTISTDDYVLVGHPDSATSPSASVGAYAGSDAPVVIKMLAGKKAQARYTISATWYQNKQNTVNPSPFGLAQAQVNAAGSDFWKIHSLSGSFKGNLVIGQRLNVSNYFDLSKTMKYPSGSRTGDLTHVGDFTAASGFVGLDNKSIVLTEDTPTTIYLGGFYNVEDASVLPVEAPTGVGSGMLSGATISFTSKSQPWKAAQTNETLLLDNPAHAAKLAAYPFDGTGDGFNAPEYVFTDDDWAWWTPAWMLGSKLNISYTYAAVPKVQYTVTFIDWDNTVLDSQVVNSGGDAVPPADPVREGYTFLQWNNGWTNVVQDMTIQAEYEADAEPITPEPETPNPGTPDPGTPDPSNPSSQKPGVGGKGGIAKTTSLPTTGDPAITLAVLLGALASVGAAGTGLAIYRKRSQGKR